MSDPIPGSLDDVNNQSSGQLTLDNYGPRGYGEPPVPFEICTVCGKPYSLKDMVKYRSKWYCRPQDCYRDIVGRELKAHPEDHFKDDSMAERFWKGGGGGSR